MLNRLISLFRPCLGRYLGRYLSLCLSLCLGLTLITGTASAQDTPRVVTVTYPLQYFAQRLLGDAAEVVFPVPQNVDPSFWRPGISDISAVQSADLIFLNGAGFATWVDRVSLPRSKVVNTSAGFRDRFIATRSVTHSHGDGGAHSHDTTASYVWLDPALALRQAETIAAVTAGRRLVAVSDVEARLDALAADLGALDAQTKELLAGLPSQTLIATHPRYQYFARAYGLTIHALDWEAGAAPDAGQLAQLAALAAETGAGTLLWEAAPPAEALASVSELGLASLIFPPLAAPPAGMDYLDALRATLANWQALHTP